LAQANVRYRASIAEAVKGADAVVNLVGILSQRGRQRFSAVQAAGAGAIAECAAAAGVKSLVHVSAIGADPKGKSLYARSKGEGEKAVRAAFPGAVIMRPSLVFGPEDEFFNRFAAMASLPLTSLPLIGGGKTRFQPVYVDDVADTICAALDAPESIGRTYELGGPRVYTFRELMELMLKTIGRRRPLVPIPFALAPILGLVGEAVGLFPIFDPPITRDQIRQLKRDSVVGASEEEGVGVISDFGLTPETLEAVLPTYLVRFRKYGQFAEQVA
ncbi:MAG TPA: complex I NDUFA9 subunit family protein, partial [Parvularculaceae bacterium]|nr:complex I NDUFA9 subunit family protein [Parvularculaceae bacterium]